MRPGNSRTTRAGLRPDGDDADLRLGGCKAAVAAVGSSHPAKQRRHRKEHQRDASRLRAKSRH
jgi:hypothetical protein